MRQTTRIVALVIVALTLLAPSRAGAQAVPSLLVQPDNDLIDGDVVMLAGSGFEPSSSVFYCQGLVVAAPTPSDCGTSVATTMADASGAFSVPVAVHRYLARSDGTVVDCADGISTCGFGATNLGSTIVVAALQFTTQPSGPDPFRATGTVTDPSGAPLAGVTVWAYRSSDSWVGSQGAITAADGTFTFEDLVPNVGYRIRALAPAGSQLLSPWFSSLPTGSPYRYQYSTEVRLTATAPTAAISTQLQAAASIEGVVTAGGTPLGNVLVSGYLPDDTWVGTVAATTDTAGEYRIEGAWPGLDLQLRFRAGSGSSASVEWYADAPTRHTASRLLLTSGQVATIDVAIGP